MYRVEAFIERCLKSCINQNLPESEYEIICVNDGTPDNSAVIVREIAKKHSNIIVIDRENGISIIDSTPLVSCHIKRMHMHKTMKGWAAKGKCTMGWFYGFKLHLVINDKGEIIQWQLTPGNVDDRAPLKDSRFTEKLFGKLFADRGYISQDLFEMLFVDDIHLVTKIKKNMKNSLMNLYDKLMLRKRSVIETVNDELKNVCQIEHTRHRSIDNFATNLFAGLIAYNLLPKKPAMNLEIIDRSRLIA